MKMVPVLSDDLQIILTENTVVPPTKRQRLLLARPRSSSFRRSRKNESTEDCMTQDKIEANSNTEMGGFGAGKHLLSTVGEWDFNMFTLNKLTNGRALFHTSLHLFQEHNLVKIFKLDIVKLMRFISLVEEGYHSSNPYHNAVHAADVAQAMHCYLQEPKLAQSLSPLEKLAALIAAITHDLDHPGVNQAFLIATSNHLAALYNNTSVLENHHWRSAVGLLHESGLFDHFDDSLWKTIEWQLKSLILATDITRQQEFLTRLKTHLDQKSLNLEDVDHKNFVMQIALKCADICNPCRAWEVSKRWSELVCDEFFKQGDCERQLNLPVTQLCDRYSTTVAKIQTGFMKFVVTPLFHEWYRFNPTPLSEAMLGNIKVNHSNWDRIDHEAEAQKMKEQEPLHEEEEDLEDEDMSSSGGGGHTIHTTVVVIEQELDENKENSEPEDSLQDLPEPSEDSPLEDHLVPLCLYRRHSLPPPLIACKDSFMVPNSRRDSFPRLLSRRYSLPVGEMPNSNSFDKLVDKLSSLVECSPTNGTHFDYDQRPRIVSISQSLDAKTLSSATLEANKQTSAHGLDPALLAQRPYTSEPHIAMLAHQYRLNNRHSNLAHFARNLTVAGMAPKLRQPVDESKITSMPVLQTCASQSQPSLPLISGLLPGGTTLNVTCKIRERESEQPQPSDHKRSYSIDTSSLCVGHRVSVGGTTSHSTRSYSQTDGEGDPLLVATHSVDAINLSGVNTADSRAAESSNHSSMTHSTNYKTVESLESRGVSMAMNKHRSSTAEEVPLLQDQLTFKDEGAESKDVGTFHANDSFTH